ncbi:hypothetical protein NM688_g2625 [Phlebia brevispora]|uniref:Uncharacterized protein n=1 Tax=Phlebia brevispora TaxID=194682 RepID=A0ACC1T7Y9_9APHY|nr:hypothetical protein NM688_g2625 [Phlebia brevispora]
MLKLNTPTSLWAERDRLKLAVRNGQDEVLAEHLGPLMSEAKPPLKKKQGRRFDSEDWCIYCRDGGELMLCMHFPRVVNPEHHELSRRAAQSTKSTITCPHHSYYAKHVPAHSAKAACQRAISMPSAMRVRQERFEAPDFCFQWQEEMRETKAELERKNAKTEEL